MPCNMYDGVTSGDVAAAGADNKAREALQRIAELEQALCGLCQMIATDAEEIPMHPQLKSWFDKHQQKPGCAAR